VLPQLTKQYHLAHRHKSLLLLLFLLLDFFIRKGASFFDIENSRGGVKDTTFEAKTKDSQKVRGQGRDQVCSRPRTERLEAKANDSRTHLKIRANIIANIVIMISQAFKCKNV